MIGTVICCPVNHPGSNSPKDSRPTVVAIVPARFDSTRLPGKVLLEIAERPMILWVIERALAARNIDRVVVATDDARIMEVVEANGYEAVMTSPNHQSGTDRVAEVAANSDDIEIVVNLQADEPLISPETIERAVDALANETSDIGIITTWEPIEDLDSVINPNVVKIVIDEQGRALYFSRSPVPHPRDAIRRHQSIEAALKAMPAVVQQFKKHTGLYVYRREVLLRLSQLPQTDLERVEQLEQLRALEHGIGIKAIEAASQSIGVDTPEDLEVVRSIMESETSSSRAHVSWNSKFRIGISNLKSQI
jgi:3-deoxy-manno-octulosonate cytidylyltransferase (CMP-KDO synthetase)